MRQQGSGAAQHLAEQVARTGRDHHGERGDLDRRPGVRLRVVARGQELDGGLCRNPDSRFALYWCRCDALWPDISLVYDIGL